MDVTKISIDEKMEMLSTRTPHDLRKPSPSTWLFFRKEAVNDRLIVVLSFFQLTSIIFLE
jgi:hypothetical protein